MARTTNSKVCRQTTAKWFLPRKKSLLFALELAFADAPTPRREGDEDEAGEGEAYARRRWERATPGAGVSYLDA